MFVRAYHRTKDDKRHAYFALVESYRTDPGPRQRIVARLGELSGDEQRRWHRTAISHTRHDDGKQLPLFLDDEHAPLPDDRDVVRIRLGKVGWTHARWCPRAMHSSVVYDDKMWVIAGFARGNRNDVWFSSDGKTWHEARSKVKWPIRHEPACLVYKNSLWLLGGFGQTLYNDVWAYTE